MMCKHYYEKRAASEYRLYMAAKNNGDTESQNKHYKEYLNYKEVYSAVIDVGNVYSAVIYVNSVM